MSIEAEATHLPTEVVVNIEGLDFGTQVTAADLTLPPGSSLAGDPAQVLLIVQEAPTAEQVEAEAADALGVVESQPASGGGSDGAP